MRICLITPGHLSTNPRLVKEADALSEAGHEVTVIAATYQAWSREADRSFATRPWLALPPIPFGPDSPWNRRLVQLARYKAARALVRGGASTMSLVRMACHPAAADLAAAAQHTPADLYIAHYVAALPAAALAAKRWGALYAFDAEDFHPGDRNPDSRHDEERRLIETIDRAYLHGCAYVTAASPGIADAYAETYSIERPTVVLNVFPRSQAPTLHTVSGCSPLSPSVYWFSQTIGPNRGLETAVRAVALARSRPHLFLRGAPASGYVSRLTSLAASEGIADRLHFLLPGLPEEMARLAVLFDVGLAAESGHTQNRRVALTNKMFTYFLAGLPTAASDIDAHRAISTDAGGAVVLYRSEDPSSLADAIDGLLTSPAALAAARSVAFALGQKRFNWDLEKHILLACVDRVLGEWKAADS